MRNREDYLALMKTVRAKFRERLNELGKEEEDCSFQLNHINNIEFLIRNREFIAKSSHLNYGEREARLAKLNNPEYAIGLTMHFEHVARNPEARTIEIEEQIDTFFRAFQVAVERNNLDGFFVTLGSGACIQAKTAALELWRKNVINGQLSLENLIAEYLWKYERPYDMHAPENVVIENERFVIQSILKNHLNVPFVNKDMSTGKIDLPTIRDFLINVKMYSEESFEKIKDDKKNTSQVELQKNQNDLPTNIKEGRFSKIKNKFTSFFKNHWKAILIGAAIGLVIAAALVAAGILTGGAVPLLVAGVAAAHIAVSHAGAIAIGATTVAVGATATGAASGGIVGTIVSKIKQASTAKINKKLKINKPQVPVEIVPEDVIPPVLKHSDLSRQSAKNDSTLYFHAKHH